MNEFIDDEKYQVLERDGAFIAYSECEYARDKLSDLYLMSNHQWLQI